jgi:hypothetical protein
MKTYNYRPVVLIYISGDAYGGEPHAWPGTGDPIVVVYDGGRYDKYNSNPGDNPLDDYAHALRLLRGRAAGRMLRSWCEGDAEFLSERYEEEDYSYEPS